MIKIIVTSDSHGKVEKLYNIYKKNKNADMFIHLGDYVADAAKVMARLGIDLICVKANGDFRTTLPLRRKINIGNTRILAVHGHIQHVKLSLTRLKFLAQELKVDIALFGHTHVPRIQNNGILFVNPGFAYRGEYAIVTIDKGLPNAELMKL